MRHVEDPAGGPASAGPPKAAGAQPPEGGPTRGRSAAVLVIAVGNRSRGDDALGPLLLDRLTAFLAERERSNDFELIEDYQLQIEHALDLAGRRLVLVIDAGTGTAAPFAFHGIAAAAPLAGHSTHALAPEAVLGVYRQINGADPPPAFVLCVRGERFELGGDLSVAACTHLEEAWRYLVALCERADVGYWRATAAPGAPASAARAPDHGLSAAR